MSKVNKVLLAAALGASVLGVSVFWLLKKQSDARVSGNLKFSKSPQALKSLIPVEIPHQVGLVIDKYDFDTGTKTRYFWDSEGVDDSIDDWYPASTVKYLAAAGALTRLTELGLNSKDVDVTFYYKKGSNTKTVPFTEILEKAIIQSDNTAYNQLVQIAGHERLHDTILADYDIHLSRPYLKDAWQVLTGSREFDAPRIRLQDRSGNAADIEPSTHQAPRACPSRSSCARLSSFTDSIYDLVLGEKFNDMLSDENREELRRVLSSPKPRGETFINAILEQIANKQFDVFHKAGFAIDYYSDSILLVDPVTRKSYAISAWGYPGRDSLTGLGVAVGRMINDDVL